MSIRGLFLGSVRQRVGLMEHRINSSTRMTNFLHPCDEKPHRQPRWVAEAPYCPPNVG
jgi:hypothetical protein